jgi:cation:H+ antiporter
MVEEVIESFVESQGLWFAVVVVIIGGILLVAFVDKLISYLTRAALGLGVSVFSLAILFTGFEFDDTILALVFAAGGLEDAALGTALGTALAIVGITLAIAAIVRPFPITIPRDYLALFVISPLILLPLVLLGNLTTIHGIGLLILFFLFLGYIIYMEHRRDVPVFRDTELVKRLETDGGVPTDTSLGTDEGFETHSRLKSIPEDRLIGDQAYAGYLWIGLTVVALAGVVFGSVLIEAGSEVVIEETGMEATVFGATVITLLLTFENILLTLEPVRQGFPEIGIGHVIGSVVFSVTGNIGFILLVADLNIGTNVLYFHLPALLIITALGAYFVSTHQIRRWHGILLGGLYLLYWVIAVVVFGSVPISG